MAKKGLEFKFEGEGKVPANTSEIIGVADPNGTNTYIELTALDNKGTQTDIIRAHVKSADINGDFAEVMDCVVEKAGLSKKNLSRIVVSPAGPISSDKSYCKLTYGDFFIDAKTLGPTVLLNDFVAKGYAIGEHVLREKNGLEGDLELFHLYDVEDKEVKRDFSAPFGVIGSGTGLGGIIMEFNSSIGFYTPSPKIGSELGHMKLSVDLEDQVDVFFVRYLQRKYGHQMATSEFGNRSQAIIDGFDCLVGIFGKKGYRDEVERVEKSSDKSRTIGEIARDNPHSLSAKNMKYFFKHTGDSLHNVAVIGNAKCGLFLSGGVTCGEVYLDRETKSPNMNLVSSINERYLNTTSPHKSWLKNVPRDIVLKRDLGLDGSRAVASNKYLFEFARLN